jgi:sec-independent protein translocase protein TatC
LARRGTSGDHDNASMAKNSTGEMPFLDHLEELRWRIIWALLAAVLGLIAGFFIVVKLQIIRILQEPIAPYLMNTKLVYTNPADPFSIALSASITVGLIIASPVIIYQLWAFLSPALHRHEKKVVIPVILGAVLLFVGGVCLAYFFVLPLTLKFLMNFQVESLQPMITASGYFGAAFELPVLILALAALGLVTPKFLSKFRPYALILAFLLSAIVTPGDIFIATLALTAPLYLLYELSVVLAMIIFRKREAAAYASSHSTAEGAA